MKHFTEFEKHCLCSIVDPVMIIRVSQEIIHKKYLDDMDDEFLQTFQRMNRAILKIYDTYFENQNMNLHA